MKKLFLLFFLFHFLTNFSSGQILIGIHGGISWPTFRNDGHPCNNLDYSYTSYPGYYMGVDIKGLIPKIKYLNLGLSIDYNLNSFNWNKDAMGLLYKSDNQYDLRMLRFYIYPALVVGKRLKFFFNIGPYLSLSVNASYTGTVKYHINPIHGDTTYSVSGILKNFKTTDVGLREGLGISYPVISYLILSVEENGGIGILNINQQEGSVKKYDIGVLLSVAYLIQKKKPKNPK
jgi:hypothetical protein